MDVMAAVRAAVADEVRVADEVPGAMAVARAAVVDEAWVVVVAAVADEAPGAKVVAQAAMVDLEVVNFYHHLRDLLLAHPREKAHGDDYHSFADLLDSHMPH